MRETDRLSFGDGSVMDQHKRKRCGRGCPGGGRREYTHLFRHTALGAGAITKIVAHLYNITQLSNTSVGAVPIVP